MRKGKRGSLAELNKWTLVRGEGCKLLALLLFELLDLRAANQDQTNQRQKTKLKHRRYPHLICARTLGLSLPAHNT
jgi:hypothetical protein